MAATFNGEAVSLSPSVGNWLQKCRSHYIVRNGKVIEAAPWSNEQISAGLAHDNAARLAMFNQSEPPPREIRCARHDVGWQKIHLGEVEGLDR